jgi:hypothetical protein
LSSDRLGSNEQRFRLRGCSEREVTEARWCLLVFPEVQNLGRLDADLVAVVYEGDGHPQQWLNRLEEHGYRFERIFP